MLELSEDPSKVGDGGTDAVALKAPSACMRLALRVATEIIAMSTRCIYFVGNSLA